MTRLPSEIAPGVSWFNCLLFFDAAYGRLNNPFSSDIQDGLGDYVNFRGVGLQARFTLPGFLESRVMIAEDVFTHWEPDNGRAQQIWADFYLSVLALGGNKIAINTG